MTAHMKKLTSTLVLPLKHSVEHLSYIRPINLLKNSLIVSTELTIGALGKEQSLQDTIRLNLLHRLSTAGAMRKIHLGIVNHSIQNRRVKI